jgi:hypothetical protein
VLKIASCYCKLSCVNTRKGCQRWQPLCSTCAWWRLAIHAFPMDLVRPSRTISHVDVRAVQPMRPCCLGHKRIIAPTQMGPSCREPLRGAQAGRDTDVLVSNCVLFSLTLHLVVIQSRRQFHRGPAGCARLCLSSGPDQVCCCHFSMW